MYIYLCVYNNCHQASIYYARETVEGLCSVFISVVVLSESDSHCVCVCGVFW